MRYASENYIAYNNANSVFTIANLYKIKTKSGSVFTLTSYDRNIFISPHMYLSGADNGATALIKRGSVRYARGTEVSTMSLTLFAGASAVMSGANVSLAAQNGYFDGCRVWWGRLKMQTPSDISLGAITMFEGAVSGVDPGSTQVVLTVKSDLEILQKQMPRVLFQPACSNFFGDPACGVNRALYQESGVLTGTPTIMSLPTNLSVPDGTYTKGVLVVSTGAAAGSRRSVSLYQGNVAMLSVPLPSVPTAGDGFTIYQNCDGTPASCSTFGGNYQGFPYVPQATTALGV